MNTPGFTALRTLLRSRFGLPLAIIAVAAVLVTLLTVTRPRLEKLPAAERVWTVSAVEVRRAAEQPELDLFGEVVAGRHSELRTLVPGRVVEVGPDFHDGALVGRGDLLLRIDAFDYETELADQRSKLREAGVRLEVVQRDRQRARDLYAQKLVAPQYLENAELAVEQQEAIVEQRRIAVRRAERDLTDTRLEAPFAGVVGQVNANLGQQLSGNDKVAEVTDIGRLEVRFSLSNAEYGRLLDSGEAIVGRPVRVSWEVGARTVEHAGHIDRVGAAITSTTGGVDVFAVIEPVVGANPLRPGAFVRVRLADRRYENVLRAPQTALYGEHTVYVIDADSRLQARRVTIRGYDGSDMLFDSEPESPIGDGARILTSQLREIGAGVKVAVR